MKKLVTLLLGAALAIGTVTAYAAPTPAQKTSKKKSTKKGTKKAPSTPKKDGGK
jgi:hypothetical protein